MQPTIAERLIDIADELRHPIGMLTLADPDSPCFVNKYLGIGLARVKLAVDFSKKPKSFQLQAIVEEWDTQRINREMY